MNYTPWDQDEHLGPPPWSEYDPHVIAWEAAHGHDVRLKCYAEYGCLVIEQDAYDRGVEDGIAKGAAASHAESHAEGVEEGIVEGREEAFAEVADDIHEVLEATKAGGRMVPVQLMHKDGHIMSDEEIRELAGPPDGKEES